MEDKDQLCVLSSGSSVSKEVEYDVPKSVTDELGNKAKKDVMQERIYKLAEKTKDFFNRSIS